MTNHGHSISSTNEQSEKTSDEYKWTNFRIYFQRKAPKFPGNKMYGIINIEPDSARTLIDKFQVFINDVNRAEFNSSYRDISLSGFGGRNIEKPISVKIKAIPKKNCLLNVERISNSCKFSFNGRIFGVSPIISFDWIHDDPRVTVIIKWYHIGDQDVQKYIVSLDKKEIYYANEQPIPPELSVFIHDLQPGKQYTVEITAKLKNGKEKYRSDCKEFTVPTQKIEKNTEVINIRSETVPSDMLAFIDLNDDDGEIQGTEEIEENLEVKSEKNNFQENAKKLLQLLHRQIEKRQKFQ